MSGQDQGDQELTDAKMRQVVKITACSFYQEMVNYGFAEGDIINFTSELLDLLMKDPLTRRSRFEPTGVRYTVDYDVDSSGGVVAVRGPDLMLRPASADDLEVIDRWRKSGAYEGTLIERIMSLEPREILAKHANPANHLHLVHLGDAAIGFVTYSVDLYDTGRAEMQKFLADRQHRGHGHGTQMTYLWLHHGFTRLSLRKISAQTVDSNLVNINLNRKLGFQFEGRLQQEVRLRDRYVDLTLMSVLRERFFRLCAEPPAAINEPE